MLQEDKTIIVAKIDTLYYSISDVQLQSILTLLRDVVNSLPIEGKKDMGFTNTK